MGSALPLAPSLQGLRSPSTSGVVPQAVQKLTGTGLSLKGKSRERTGVQAWSRHYLGMDFIGDVQPRADLELRRAFPPPTLQYPVRTTSSISPCNHMAISRDA